VFNFLQQPQKDETPRDKLLRRLREGVPPELVCRAHSTDMETLNADPDAVVAMAEGEILLFERARDSGVTGIVRAAMRHEAKSWQPKAEPNSGQSLEDLLRGPAEPAG